MSLTHDGAGGRSWSDFICSFLANSLIPNALILSFTVIDVLALLEKALACYKQLQDIEKQIEVYYIMARAQHEAGLFEERNRSSAHFKRQMQRKEEAMRTTDMLGLYYLDAPAFTFHRCAQTFLEHE